MPRVIVSRSPNWSGLGPQSAGAMPGEMPSEPPVDGAPGAAPGMNIRPGPSSPRPPVPQAAMQPLGQAGRNFPTLPSRLASLPPTSAAPGAVPTALPADTQKMAPVAVGATPAAMPDAMPVSKPMPPPVAPPAAPSSGGLINQVK